jgi:hypothetical protein
MERWTRLLMLWCAVWGAIAPVSAEAGPLRRLRERVQQRRQVRETPPPPAPAKPVTAAEGQAAIDEVVATISGFSGGSQATTALNQLTDDVRITGENAPADGEALTFDQGTGFWVPAAGGGGASDLVDLGDITNVETATAGHFLKANGDDTFTFEEVVGGSGLTYDGTIGDGQFGTYDDTDNVYIPTYAGAPTYNVTNYIGGIRAGGSSRQTTGIVSAASNSMTVAAAWDGAEGHCVAIQGAGADHSLGTPNAPFVMTIGTAGATSRDYRVCAGSGNGGHTTSSSITTLTTSHATLDATNYNRIFIDAVTGALGGYAIYGRDTTDANHYKLTDISSTVTCLKLTFDAGGYNDFETADLGTSITAASGSHTGTIVGFDNTARTCYVVPAAWDGAGADTFPSATSTVTAGSDGGTTSGAATNAVYWNDQGDTVTATPYMVMGRRSSTRMYVGQRMLYPASSSGNMYRVISVDNDELTDSSAPIYDTDLGDLTVDGNVTLIRENTVFPVAPPAAAVYDFLRTSVTAVSGTTITLADNATTSVTSKTVFRDDLTPIQSWWNVCRASGGVGALHFPADREYPLLPGPMTGSAADARWGTPTGGGNNQYALFDWYYSSGTKRLRRAWHLEEGASVVLMPGQSAGAMTDGLNTPWATTYLFRYAYSEPMIYGGGEISYSPISDPVLEHSAGWNHTFISGMSSSVSSYDIAGPYWIDTNFFGWPRLTGDFHQPSVPQAMYYRNCNFTYGGSDHDGGLYPVGGRILGGSSVGIRFTRSTGIYQDFNTIDTPLLIDGFYGEGFKKDGIRVRQNDFKLVNSVLNNCVQVYATEALTGFNVSSNTLTQTNVVTAFASNAADDVTIHHNKMVDSQITIDAASDRVVISKNTLTFGSALASNLTSGGFAILANGSDTKVIENFVDTSTISGDFRACSTAGTSNRIWLARNTFRGNGIWETWYGTGSGRRWIEGNYFYNGGGGNDTGSGYGGMVIASGTADYKFANNVWEDGTASNVVGFYTGGRIEVSDTFLCKSHFASGITGPLYIKGGMHQSATATTIVEPNAIVEGNNFATNPTLTGATLATRGNRVADALSVTAAALAISTNNDVALPVTDQVRLDPHASNSIVTSFVARADGTEVTIICTDAGAATLTIDSSAATGTAANKIMCPGDTDIVMSSGERIVIRYDATTSLWYVIGGQYVATIWNRDAQRAFEGSWVLAV